MTEKVCSVMQITGMENNTAVVNPEKESQDSEATITIKKRTEYGTLNVKESPNMEKCEFHSQLKFLPRFIAVQC